MMWIESALLRWGNWRWRSIYSLTVPFILLSIFFVYDRTYIDKAFVMLDDELAAEVFIDRISRPGSFLSLPSTSPVPAGCDIFDGKWVKDESYPLYDTCLFAEQEFQCHLNGRTDRRYQKWRWQPRGCDIPRFDAKDMLRRLKGKRVVVVGDSMGRSQWESLSCLLLQGVTNKSSVHLMNEPITKLKWHLGALFDEDNVTLDYYRSPWLVKADSVDMPKRIPRRIRFTLKLKKVDLMTAQKFLNADVLVINSGHWWVSRKTIDDGGYFQIDDQLKLGMPVNKAFEIAMKTVTSFLNKNVDFNRTEVFFRTFETAHWEDLMASKPYGKNFPVLKGEPRAEIVKEAVRKMEQHATLLNVTYMSASRPDGHVFNWTGNNFSDGAHWCLPGVPDTWNELLYGSLLQRGREVWGTGLSSAGSKASVDNTLAQNRNRNRDTDS